MIGDVLRFVAIALMIGLAALVLDRLALWAESRGGGDLLPPQQAVGLDPGFGLLGGPEPARAEQAARGRASAGGAERT